MKKEREKAWWEEQEIKNQEQLKILLRIIENLKNLYNKK